MPLTMSKPGLFYRRAAGEMHNRGDALPDYVMQAPKASPVINAVLGVCIINGC